MQSPSGSPTGGGLDGAELARRMIVAAEAAATAAQVAAQALQEQQGARTAEKEKDWFKLVPKPATFDPSSREQEIAQWKDWWWSVEQFLATVDSDFQLEIDLVKSHVEQPEDHTQYDAAQLKRAHFLYSLLASLLRGRLLSVLKGVGNNNGYEALRQLFSICQPPSRNRALGLLNAIMGWQNFNMKSPLLPQILKLEEAFREYQRVASDLADEIKFAVLLRCVGGQLRMYLNVNVTETQSYSDLREAILRYDRATVRWTDAMALGTDLSAGVSEPFNQPVDMDVGRVKGDEKGKGKGKKGQEKGKGKRLGQQQYGFGKGKGKQDKGKGKGSWNSWNFDAGQKGIGKGKTKDKTEVVCHSCGKKGHYARDCWSRGNNPAQQQQQAQSRVRQVQTEGEQQTQPTAQGNVSPEATSLPSASQRVRRVEFDLTGSYEYSAYRVRAVQVGDRACEHFFIGCDDDNDVFEVPDGVPTWDLYPSSTSTSSWMTSAPWMECYDVTSAPVSPPHLGDVQWKPSFQTKTTPLFPKLDFAVRTVMSQTDKGLAIVLDSGSDATVIPQSMAQCGEAAVAFGNLWDAQGNSISTSGCRDISVQLFGEGGEEVIFRDRGYVSSSVKQPLLSYGRLLRQGWSIVMRPDGPKLEHAEAEVRIPIEFCQDSLSVRGSIRRVNVVRHLPATPPPAWTASWTAESPWRTTSKGYPLLLSKAFRFVDPSPKHGLGEWPYRTTLAFDGGQWYMIEFCEDMRAMPSLVEPVDQKYSKLLTVLTMEVLTPETIGFSVSSELSSASSPLPQRAADVEGRQVGGDVEPAEGGGMDVEVPVEAPYAWEFGAEEDGPHGDSCDAHPEIPKYVALLPDDDSLEIEGVRLTASSAAKLLKAACSSLRLSQAGSRAKLWDRLQKHWAQQRLKMSSEIAQTVLDEVKKDPIPQAIPAKPEDPNEVLLHQLTHHPYQAWCESCVMGKGRPDAHFTDEERYVKREHPCVSFDLCYTRKRVGESALPVEESEGVKVKLTCLVLIDSSSRAVHAVPVFSKSDIRLMAKEICRFVQWHGHPTVALRCDQEPVMLRVQYLAQQSLLKMGCKVLIENSKLRDHSSNSLAESVVHRVRQMSTVLISAVESKLGLDVPIDHALMSWSWVHSCWLMNRFNAFGNITPFEQVHGRAYTGKLCEFGEPILAYVSVSPGPKGGARWEPSVFIGKSAQNDMFICAKGNTIRLTRSIKRVYSDQWPKHLVLYQQMAIPTWMVEVRGNKLLPRLREKSEPPLALDAGVDNPSDDGPGSDEAASDPPSEVEANLYVAPVTPRLPPMREARAANTPRNTPRGVPATPTLATAEQPESSKRPAEGDVSLQSEARKLEPIYVVRPPEEMGGVALEPAAKRPKLAVMSVGKETLYHMDEEISGEDFEIEAATNLWQDGECEEVLLNDQDLLWFPFSSNEPELPDEVLQELDNLADKVEVERLLDMKVMCRSQDYNDERGLGVPLSAKFVRTWRKKERNGEQMWLRRSRLVAREFSFMEKRTVCSCLLQLVPENLASSCSSECLLEARSWQFGHWRCLSQGSASPASTGSCHRRLFS